MRSQEGFTLGALLMALAIISVIALGVIPTLQRLLVESNLTAATNELITALHMARSEAIKRRTRVTLCASEDGKQCTRGGVGYHVGWMIFEDPNASVTVEPGETVISVMGASDVVIAGNAPVRDYVSYVATGLSQATSGALQMGTLRLCASRIGRQITINVGGRVRASRVDC